MGVLTAALAVIKVQGVVVGKMRNIRVNEGFQRGRVVGLGAINASELPVTGFTGTLNCSYYVFDFSNHPMFDAALLRKTNNAKNFINTILLDENGFDLDLLKKEADVVGFPPFGKDANGIAQVVEVSFASIRKIFVTGDNFDISEGQISGRDGTFEYLDPIVGQI